MYISNVVLVLMVIFYLYHHNFETLCVWGGGIKVERETDFILH